MRLHSKACDKWSARSSIALLARDEDLTTAMENRAPDHLAQFGLDAIDLRGTMKDIAGKRWQMPLNQAHLTN
jgi:hypothetical protein